MFLSGGARNTQAEQAQKVRSKRHRCRTCSRRVQHSEKEERERSYANKSETAHGNHGQHFAVQCCFGAGGLEHADVEKSPRIFGSLQRSARVCIRSFGEVWPGVCQLCRHRRQLLSGSGPAGRRENGGGLLCVGRNLSLSSGL